MYSVVNLNNDIPVYLIEDSLTGFDWSVGGRHRSVFDYSRAKELARLLGGWVQPVRKINEVAL